MAPTKKDGGGEKGAKLTSEQSTLLILDHLRKQNRPYSATDISANLKNRVTKSAAAKLLKDMHERAEIEGRAAGKQLVYHALQDEPDELAVEDLQRMDARTNQLQEALTALKAQEKDLRTAIRQQGAQVPIVELKSAITASEDQISDLEERSSKLRSGSVKAVSLEQRERVWSEHARWQKLANARRKIRAQMWAEIGGMVEKDRLEETKEALGLEL